MKKTFESPLAFFAGLKRDGDRTREIFLMVLAMGIAVSMEGYVVLINNFGVEKIGFTGRHIGWLHTVREIPGFLAIGAVYLLIFLRDQYLGVFFLATFGVGTALTGAYLQFSPVLVFTMIGSVGFHYCETVKRSMALQWFDVEKTPKVLGRIKGAASSAALLFYVVFLSVSSVFAIDYGWAFLCLGTVTLGFGLFAFFAFPGFAPRTRQKRAVVLRSRYWLYYLLTFLGGARRQIFVVFAGFLMVEKFGFKVGEILLLYLANHLLTTWIAPRIGRLVARFGERKILTVEYSGLIVVFTSYAFCENAYLAVGLFLVDHLLFSMAIAMESYFKKIADPSDIASNAGVAFTINHVAAVFLPALLGGVWLFSPQWVFLTGSGIAFASLVLAALVPANPVRGCEWVGKTDLDLAKRLRRFFPKSSSPAGLFPTPERQKKAGKSGKERDGEGFLSRF